MRSFFNKSLHSLSSKSIRVSGSTYLTTSLLTLVGRKKSPLNTPLLENVATLNPVFFFKIEYNPFFYYVYFIFAEYFGNVLEEMSLTLSTNLQQIIVLLRAPLDQYNAVSVGYNPRVVASIRQKRNILSC